MTPIQRYYEILFEKWTMSAIWLYNTQTYWSDKNSGVDLLTYAASEDTNDDLQLRLRSAYHCLVERHGPSDLVRFTYGQLVNRYGPPEIPCEYTEMASTEILLDTDSVALIR
jgi:hypothetical protein